MAIQGQGTVRRSPGIYQETYECYYAPCWTYSGDQTYGIKPLSAAINLTTPGTVEAAPGIIEKPQPGNWTLFKVTANPATIKNIQVPIKVLSWSWTAASGGAGQTVLTGGATAIQRSVYIQEEGRMVVDAIVNGAEQLDTISVVIPVIRVVPEKTTMKPSIRTPYNSPSNPGRNEPSTQTITVSVSGFNSVPLLNKSVKLAALAIEGTAGHTHTGGKPPGQLVGATWAGDTTRVNTGASGVVTAMYVAPDPSGPVTIRGTLTGATTGNAQIDVAVTGLAQYTAGAHYGVTGDIPARHPSNHWATQEHLAKLTEFADSVFARFGVGPTFNDTSLQFGGLYDVDGAAVWNYPHKAHREGRNTDLRTNDVPKERLRIMKEKWERLGGDVYKHSDHYHLTF